MGKIEKDGEMEAENMNYVQFAMECTDRAKGWLEKYEEQPAILGPMPGRLVRLSIMTARRRKLELAVKNLKTAIAEIEVEMSYTDMDIEKT